MLKVINCGHHTHTLKWLQWLQRRCHGDISISSQGSSSKISFTVCICSQCKGRLCFLGKAYTPPWCPLIFIPFFFRHFSLWVWNVTKVVVCNAGLLQREGCYCYPETPGLVGNGGNSRMFPYMPIAILTRWFWNQNFLFPNVDYFPSFLNIRFLGALSNFRTIGPVRISSRTLSDPVLIPSLIWPQLKGLHSAFPTPRLKARENTQHKSLS